MKKYQLAVINADAWDSIHHLLCDETDEENIPNRAVECFDDKLHSKTRGTFLLDDDEALELSNHPLVKWIEVDPQENSYIKPVHTASRYKGTAKVYRNLSIEGPPPTNPPAEEARRTGWGPSRTSAKSLEESIWNGAQGNIPPQQADVPYSLTGKNVDVVIIDSGILQYHPEYRDANGVSRVYDIVIDGPYEIDPDWFNDDPVNRLSTRPDGRVRPIVDIAIRWWRFANERSPQFADIGTVFISAASYTENNSLGTNPANGSNNLFDGHGNCCAALACGNWQGSAPQARIWNVSGAVATTTNLPSDSANDLVKLFHLYKPINPETGVKNPTVVNASYGFRGEFTTTTNVSYDFRGTVGTFNGNAPTTDLVTAMKNGFYLAGFNNVYQYATGSPSLSIQDALDEMIEAGVIHVTSGGNNNQKLAKNNDDPDVDNYLTNTRFDSPGGPGPAGTGACNGAKYLFPANGGYDSEKDFLPSIIVGALDDFIDFDPTISEPVERKANYSNNGPAIDVWAPAQDTLAAGTNNRNTYFDYQRADNPAYFDTDFNGTSAAAPVATGVIACYLQANPTASSREVKAFIRGAGKQNVGQYLADPITDDQDFNYWLNDFNLRGASPNILFNPSANNKETSIG